MSNNYAVPTAVTIGKRKIKVELCDQVFVGTEECRGAFDYEAGHIAIAKQAATRQHNTLWHEMTHAILYDMGRYKLTKDEVFVTGLSSRLHKAIASARF